MQFRFALGTIPDSLVEKSGSYCCCRAVKGGCPAVFDVVVRDPLCQLLGNGLDQGRNRIACATALAA